MFLDDDDALMMMLVVMWRCHGDDVVVLVMVVMVVMVMGMMVMAVMVMMVVSRLEPRTCAHNVRFHTRLCSGYNCDGQNSLKIPKTLNPKS
jgi:hypothetical protein